MRKLSLLGIAVVLLGPIAAFDEHFGGAFSFIQPAFAQQMGRAPIDVRGGSYELNRAALIEAMRNQNANSSSSSSGSSGATTIGPTTVYTFNSTAVDNLNQITQTLSGGSNSNLSLGVKQTGNNSTQSATTTGSVSESLNQILLSGAAQQ